MSKGLELVKKILASNFSMDAYHDPSEEVYVEFIKSEHGAIEGSCGNDEDSVQVYSVCDNDRIQFGFWCDEDLHNPNETDDVKKETELVYALLKPVFHAWELP